jgi:hypothetical protein
VKVYPVFLATLSFCTVVFGLLIRVGGPSPTWDVAVAIAVVSALLAIVAELREIARILSEQKRD